MVVYICGLQTFMNITKNGGLWRWDGYTHTENAKTPANQILQNKTNINKLNPKKNVQKEIISYEAAIFNLTSKTLLSEKNKIENNEDPIKINNSKINIRSSIEKEQSALSIYIESNNESKTKLAILESSKSKNEYLLKTLSMN